LCDDIVISILRYVRQMQHQRMIERARYSVVTAANRTADRAHQERPNRSAGHELAGIVSVIEYGPVPVSEAGERVGGVHAVRPAQGTRFVSNGAKQPG
jgi:hypothetical protein